MNAALIPRRWNVKIVDGTSRTSVSSRWAYLWQPTTAITRAEKAASMAHSYPETLVTPSNLVSYHHHQVQLAAAAIKVCNTCPSNNSVCIDMQS